MTVKFMKCHDRSQHVVVFIMRNLLYRCGASRPNCVTWPKICICTNQSNILECNRNGFYSQRDAQKHCFIYSCIFFKIAVIWHFSLAFIQFCFLFSSCFSITYSIIVCLEVKEYKIIRYACKCVCTYELIWQGF